MKKLLLVLIGIFTISMASAQKLKVNEVDKFTKSVKKETSHETLYSSGIPMHISSRFAFSIRKIGENYSMPAFIVLPDMEKYTEDSGVTFLLSNDETVTLYTDYTGIGSEGHNPNDSKGYGFSTCFQLSQEAIDKLKNNEIVSVRVNYMGGHYDRDLKKNKQDIVSKCLKLVDSE